MERIHLDHNATTPLRPEARAALLDVLDRGLGNASAVHASGRAARAVVDEARERVAAALGVREDAVVFTSGGTEADNLALFGAAQALPGARILSSPLEHAAVGGPVRVLEEAGSEVHWAANDTEGRLDLGSIARVAAQEGPLICSLMGANSELGTLNDLSAVRAALEQGARGADGPRILHSDAVQVLGKAPIAPVIEACDLVSLSAHKVGGPVGVGVLVRRPGTPLVPRTHGGSQEAGTRPGTENVAGIAAASVAIELAIREADAVAQRLRPVLATFWKELSNALPDARWNGPPPEAADRLPNTANVSFPNSGDARMLVTRFDLAGLETSAGSACASGSLEPSHVLVALGLDDETRVRSAVRFSFGRDATADDAWRAVERLRRTLGEAP